MLLFTAFADTAEYLYEHLPRCFRNGMACTPPALWVRTGPSPRLARKADFQELLTLFSPRSKEKALLLPDVQDEIDLLIATDCISEGQNLQDCDYLINYDIHWNPVRIIQRFGRIDRIGSKNASIQLVNYWPDISLDEYIRLKERVESRMVIADVTATGDENPLDGRSNDLAYRKEQLRRYAGRGHRAGRSEGRRQHHRPWPQRLPHGPAQLRQDPGRPLAAAQRDARCIA